MKRFLELRKKLNEEKDDYSRELKDLSRLGGDLEHVVEKLNDLSYIAEKDFFVPGGEALTRQVISDIEKAMTALDNATIRIDKFLDAK